jgi:hypothetical protein
MKVAQCRQYVEDFVHRFKLDDFVIVADSELI